MTDDYATLLHELHKLRTGNAATAANAHHDWRQRRDRLDETLAVLSTERDKLVDLATTLRVGVPDLRFESTDSPTPDSFEDELNNANHHCERARSHHSATMAAAALPPLLPRVTPIVRNFVVYGLAMVVCFAAQLGLSNLARTGVIPQDSSLWIAFLTPVLFLVAGYLATGIAGSPKLETFNAKGEPVAFVVFRSPRLGAFLAVMTMIGFLVRDLI